jgi:hypothetical protein
MIILRKPNSQLIGTCHRSKYTIMRNQGPKSYGRWHRIGGYSPPAALMTGATTSRRTLLPLSSTTSGRSSVRSEYGITSFQQAAKLNLIWMTRTNAETVASILFDSRRGSMSMC